MNRYVTTMDIYVYASSDEEAIEKSVQLADEIAKKDDNHCEVINIVEQPFATIGNRQVYGSEIEIK